jgi:DNA-binding beta-propeller fold protein YncE
MTKGDATDMANTLLRYALTTAPFPLQASAQSGNANIATLTLVATNATDKGVTLQGVIVTLPVGDGAAELTADPKNIGPVPPANWKLAGTQYPKEAVQYTFQPIGDGTVGNQQALTFTFNNVALNRTPGTCEVVVMEGSNDCQPPACPTADLYVTKFPNGWGQVSFWVEPAVVSPGGGTTLNWTGPAGATYTIEYYMPQTGIVNVPAAGQPPLASQGQYPGPADPPLQIEQTTTFTLGVNEIIGNQSFQAQDQQTVTVALPPPIITLFKGKIETVNEQLELILNWNTSLADYCTITGDPNQLQTSSTDNSYIIQPTPGKPLLTSYTLTAANAAGNTTSTVTLYWSAETNTVAVAGMTPQGIVVSPDGTWVYTAASTLAATNTLTVLDASTDAVFVFGETGEPQVAWPLAIALSVDGTYLLVTDLAQFGVVEVLKPTLNTSNPLARVGASIAAGTSSPTAIAAAPDGSHVLVAGRGPGVVSVFELTGNSTNPLQQAQPPIPMAGDLSAIAITPDGTRAYVLAQDSQTLAALDLTTQPYKPLGQPYNLGHAPNALAISPDGQRIYVSCGVILLFAPTDDPTNPFKQVGGPVTNISDAICIALSSDGSCLFVTTPGSYGSGSAQVFDTTVEPFQRIGPFMPVGQWPLGIAVAPNGARAYVFSNGLPQAFVSVLLRSSVSGGTP